MKILFLISMMLNAAFALEKHEDKYPSGETKLIYYYSQSDGKESKEGYEREYFKDGKVKRESVYKNNAKNGTEKIFDEDGMVLEQINYKDGKIENREETFEAENENGYRKKYLIGINPLPLLLGIFVEKGLAIPANPVELGYHFNGYYGLKISPALIVNGEGGWGLTGGVVVSDVADSWIGNMVELRYGYYDINKFGSSWNAIGAFYKNYHIQNNFILFWGVDVGWGLNGIKITKSTDSFTGESKVIDRELDEGFIFGLGGGMAFYF